MKKSLISILVFLFLQMSLFAEGLDGIQYRDDTDNKISIHTLKIQNADQNLQIHYFSDYEYYTVTNAQSETVSMNFRNSIYDSEYNAVRKSDIISISGKINGKIADKDIKIDSGSWYQAAEYSLMNFVLSGEKSCKYWLVSPADLKATKFVAYNEGIETITLNKSKVQAYRVRVTLDNWMSVFWSVNYWFRASDGLYIKFEGARGAPGTPKTLVEIIGEQEI